MSVQNSDRHAHHSNGSTGCEWSLGRGRFVPRGFLGKLLVLLAIGLADLRCALAVNLAWDPSPDTNVTGYVIYYGTNSGNYQTQIDVGNKTTTSLSNLSPGMTYYFVVTAHTADGVESLPSNEVAYVVPGLLLLTFDAVNRSQVNFVSEAGKMYYLQVSSNLVQWDTAQQMQSGSNAWVYFLDSTNSVFPARFYRILTDS
jgi:hypothetical protein